MAPVDSRFLIFAKLGVVRRSVTVTSGITTAINAYYLAPLFGIGFQFNISETITLGMQYIRVPGYQNRVTPESTHRFNTPSANLLVLTLGYNFF